MVALAGVFAAGPLSDAVVRDPRSGLAVSYERFLRLGHPDMLVSDVGERSGTGSVRLSLPATYLERFVPQSIAPEPKSHTATRNAVSYLFEPGTRRVSLPR